MSPVAASHRHDAYGDFLKELDPITEDSLREAIDQLPPYMKERLAKGPIQRRWSCQVCDALDSNLRKDDPFDAEDPRWIVFAFHEIPKTRCKRRDDLHYGPIANEIYERCLTTYRLAGWTGEAPEANA